MRTSRLESSHRRQSSMRAHPGQWGGAGPTYTSMHHATCTVHCTGDTCHGAYDATPVSTDLELISAGEISAGEISAGQITGDLGGVHSTFEQSLMPRRPRRMRAGGMPCARGDPANRRAARAGVRAPPRMGLPYSLAQRTWSAGGHTFPGAPARTEPPLCTSRG